MGMKFQLVNMAVKQHPLWLSDLFTLFNLLYELAWNILYYNILTILKTLIKIHNNASWRHTYPTDRCLSLVERPAT